jgi:heme/copper-type cytochrome/quinol oxidase subunit 2
MDQQTIITLLLLISPIFLIQIGLAIYSLVDLTRRKVVHGPRWLWAVILILTMFAVPSGIIGSGVYLAWGRHTEIQDDTD